MAPTRNPHRTPGAPSWPAAPPERASDTSRAHPPRPAPHGTGTEQSPAAQARVIKKLRPGQPGSKKLLRRFGDALVCVRYRQDGARAVRYTTVELIVEEAPTATRPPRPPAMVLVRIDIEETALQRQAKAHGARWDHARQA